MGTAESTGATANSPTAPTTARKLKKTDPEWQDIQDALDILDKAGYPWVRKCIEEMMDDDNITIDPTMSETGKYSGGLGPEEMYLNPSGFPSHQSRRAASGQDANVALDTKGATFKLLVGLAGTLLHECKHRKNGLLGRLANYWGSKIGELSVSADGEEALTHHSEFLFYYGLFTDAQFSGTKCIYLDQLITLMEEKILVIEQEYSPFSLLAGMKRLLAEVKEQYRRLCGGSSGATVVNGFWDVKTGRIVGTVTRVQLVRIDARLVCEGQDYQPIGGRVHGWPLRPQHVKEGEKVILTPPPVHQGGKLESVEVNGQPARIVGGKVTVTVTGTTRIVFKYRCPKDLARAAAAEQAALAEQARQAAADATRLEAQEQALAELDRKCEEECEKLRRQIADLEARIAQAQAELAALEGQLAVAAGKVAATEQEIADLDQALDDWNQMTPEEQDAERRQAAQDYEQASKDAAAERAAAAQELEQEWQELGADRTAAAQRGSGHYFGQLPGFRARSRASWDKYKARTDAADAKVGEAWQRHQDADIENQHARRMPGLTARLAAEQAAMRGLEAQVAAKEAQIADLEAKKALLEAKLRLCHERWQRVRAQLGLVSDAARAARNHLSGVREALGQGGSGDPTPQEVAAAKARREALEREQKRLRALLAEQEERRRQLEAEAKELDEERQALGEDARQARAEGANAEADGAGARAQAARMGAALEDDQDGQSDEDKLALLRLQNMYRFWQEALARAWGAPTPDLTDPEAMQAWEFSQECLRWQLEGWRAYQQETEELLDDAVLRRAAADDPGVVRRRQGALNREAATLEERAMRQVGKALDADLEAAGLRGRQTQAEQEALVADSLAFEAMFALALIEAELAAMGGAMPASGLEVEIRPTGEETGHVLDAVVTNLGEQALTFVLERGLVFLSGSPEHSDMAVSEPVVVELEPGETATVPVQGCSTDPDKSPAGRGGDGPSYRRGSVSPTFLGILDTTDEVLAEQGMEANSQTRAAVAQWALWRQGGMPRSRMTVAAFMETVEFLGLLSEGNLGGLLGGLLGSGQRQEQAQDLMDAVDEVVARGGEG